MMRHAIALALGLASMVPVVAEETARSGVWTITVNRDRFDDSKANVTAFVLRGADAFGLRCLDGELSFALMDARPRGGFADNQVFTVKMRADRGEIFQLAGLTVNEHLVELVAKDRAPFEGIVAAREIALRVESMTARYDIVFPARGAAGAVKTVLTACPDQPEAGAARHDKAWK